MANDRGATASRVVEAEAATIFELIADPSQQPRWDGNDNLAKASSGQRVTALGDVFLMELTSGVVRENHVDEYQSGRLIAWRPAEPGKAPSGQLWRWELQPLPGGRTLVTHTYDWSELADEARFERARATTPDKLMASVERLAMLVESGPVTPAGS